MVGRFFWACVIAFVLESVSSAYLGSWFFDYLSVHYIRGYHIEWWVDIGMFIVGIDWLWTLWDEKRGSARSGDDLGFNDLDESGWLDSYINEVKSGKPWISPEEAERARKTWPYKFRD